MIISFENDHPLILMPLMILIGLAILMIEHSHWQIFYSLVATTSIGAPRKKKIYTQKLSIVSLLLSS